MDSVDTIDSLAETRASSGVALSMTLKCTVDATDGK